MNAFAKDEGAFKLTLTGRKASIATYCLFGGVAFVIVTFMLGLWKWCELIF